MKQGDVVSYLKMCTKEGVNLQKGMNYHLKGRSNVILMSVRPGAPYADRVEENGRILIYEGHDIPRQKGSPNPKTADQQLRNPGGTLTEKGLFFESAMKYKESKSEPELVRVYEKIRSGIWVYNELFKLVDSWQEKSGSRKVFKFKLELAGEPSSTSRIDDLDHDRLIPTSVKLEVWKRDKGRCVTCGSQNNLHFDHIIPYAKGGSSLVAKNIQILCARHNLQKRDRIE